MLDPYKIFILDPRRHITPAIKRDKENKLHSFKFLKTFSDVPQRVKDLL